MERRWIPRGFTHFLMIIHSCLHCSLYAKVHCCIINFKVESVHAGTKIHLKSLQVDLFHGGPILQHYFEVFGLEGSVFGLGGQNTAKYLDPGSSNYFRGGPNTAILSKVHGQGRGTVLGGAIFCDRSMTVPSLLELSAIPYPCVSCPSPFAIAFALAYFLSPSVKMVCNVRAS